MPTNYLGESLSVPEPTVTPAEAPTNSNATTAVPSNYEICERSGFKVKAGELKREWDGAMVHPRFWEPRHSLDFVRSKPEHRTGSPSPEQTDTFIGDDIYPNGVSVSDLG